MTPLSIAFFIFKMLLSKRLLNPTIKGTLLILIICSNSFTLSRERSTGFSQKIAFLYLTPSSMSFICVDVVEAINTAFIFLIAFVHLVHVLVALLALIVVFVKNLKGVYNHENYTGFDLASIFWHFVDILWIYLFIFLVFFG